jgi:hypothetical protein
MTKLHSLFGGSTTDTEKKAVEVNQIIQMESYSHDRYVVYEITHDPFGYHYHLINLKTLDLYQTEIIEPLSQKFGIGYYYDEHNIEFMPEAEVAELYIKAQSKEEGEQDAEKKESQRKEAVKVIGRKWLNDNLPEDAQAIIVACFKQDESDSQSDYYASSTVRTVILGFSKHKRDLFSEMRKHASNFEETAHLAEYNEDYEHREKYSMGAGYYLGESKYRGWIIEKEPIYNRESAIEEFAYTAGNEDNIRINRPDATPPSTPTDTGNTNNTGKGKGKNGCTLVEYSAKAVAVFGDTKTIKEELKAMGGKFNARLTFNGEKLAGWVFSKASEQRLACYFGLD